MSASGTVRVLLRPLTSSSITISPASAEWESRRPGTLVPSARVRLTRRPTLRSQCRSSVRGRSIPGEETSRVYASLPSTELPSSASDTARETSATSSRLIPRPRSTSTRTTRRRPTVRSSTSSRSAPVAATTGSRSPITRSRAASLGRAGMGPPGAPRRHRPVLCCCRGPVVVEQLWGSDYPRHCDPCRCPTGEQARERVVGCS